MTRAPLFEARHAKQRPSRPPPTMARSGRMLNVHLAAAIQKLASFFCHARLSLLPICGANFLADLHGAKFGPAHGTEVRGLRVFMRQGFVVILAGALWIETQ